MEMQTNERLGFHMVPRCPIYQEVGIGLSATVRVTGTGCEAFTTPPRQLLVR
jgi:Xaa-Pro aminopeptidase